MDNEVGFNEYAWFEWFLNMPFSLYTTVVITSLICRYLCISTTFTRIQTRTRCVSNSLEGILLCKSRMCIFLFETNETNALLSLKID